MYVTYQAPQTEDGRIVDVGKRSDGELVIRAEFRLPEALRCKVDEPDTEVQFASRSRIARMGIDILPEGETQFEGEVALLTAVVRSVVASYGIGELLEKVFLPGLHIGRLVFCDRRRRLTSGEIFEEYSTNGFKLPAAFSIDATGRFTIQPHRLVYEIHQPLSVQELFAVLLREDGKSLLNRLQVPCPVDNIVLEPGQGVITSCTMFLHRHYVVLESDPTEFGRHMHAVVLDPVTTRGPRIFLEFFNDSNQTIVNPSVSGTLFRADVLETPVRTWDGHVAQPTDDLASVASSEYARLSGLFEQCGNTDDPKSYFNRAVAVLRGERHGSRQNRLSADWVRPVVKTKTPLDVHAARCCVASHRAEADDFGTRIVGDLPADGRATVLLNYFPNLNEHMDLMTAAAQGKLTAVAFKNASFEHGPFLSARDHARLADYADLGVQVFWCNDMRSHVATHVFRGRRGYFCQLDKVDAFKRALVLGVYGSSNPLPPEEANRLASLLQASRDFFGKDLAILTGGGPGAMQQASDAAKSLGLLVGASYLETEDQETNQLAEFYQVFQENCRHSRQRWFEIASFHVFCVGGVGTLEEIGITLTDMKLGLADETPVVFFGRGSDDLYWHPLKEQLRRIVEERRGPSWLRSHVLLTDDPAEVVAFYKSTLSLG